MKKLLIFGGVNISLLGFLMLFFVSILGGGSASAQNGSSNINITPITPNMTQQQFIDTLAPTAVQTYHDYGVLPSITLAQAILESGWGQTGLATKADNLFGIKAYNWSGPYIEMLTNEEYNGMTVTITDKFRVYSTITDSVIDHGKFLKENSTYTEHGLYVATDYVGQANALKAAGYATESNYPELLSTLIKQFSLDQYDSQ